MIYFLVLLCDDNNYMISNKIINKTTSKLQKIGKKSKTQSSNSDEYF